MTSTHRHSRAYRAAAAAYRTGHYPCEINGPTCTGRGSWVDHYPPLAGRTEQAWLNAGGTYRPGCPACQCRQGARIANRARVGLPPPADTPPWTW